MARCAACGSDNPDTFTFCGSCGASIGDDGCAACGFVNPPGQRFCGRCGTALSTAVVQRGDAVVEERRLATVLFADVVGFTSLADDADPEHVARTVDAALRRMAAIVVEHGGTIDKYLGDALMALFGVPAAHDDDAERAVAAALAMRDAGGELRFSIGINSGEVMVTAVGDGGDVTVIGDPVNVAARLEKAAGPGEILVGPLTAELVSDRFVLKAREPTMLKGKRQPVAAFEVVGPRTLAHADGRSEPPLVGRDAELDFLRTCWQRSVAGRRARVVLIAGDAGVGKTRLADEVSARIEADGSVVRAVCPGYGALVGARLALELSRQLSPAGSTGGDDAATGDAPATLDEHGIWRLRRLIAARAAEHPLLLVIDDCHHASAADLDPLVQLAARTADLPLLILLLGRPQPATWLTKFTGSTTVHLDTLSPADAAQLATLMATDPAFDAGDAAALVSQAGGNPLHLRELVNLGHTAVPPSLQAVLAARLDAIPVTDKAVLQAVSIFSDGAAPSEVAAITGSDVQESLDRLATAGLLAEHDGRHLVADPLLREVAYEQMTHTARGDRHRRAAAVASTSLGRARHLGLAARYLPDDAELRQQAATELGRAGVELLAVSHVRDGLQLLRRGLELGLDDPEALLQLAETEIDIGETTPALAVLDRIATDGDSRMEVLVAHARANALRSTDAERSAALLADVAVRWTELGDQVKHAWALSNRGMTLFELGRTEEAAAEHDAALAIFTRLGDRLGMAAASQALALERPDDPHVPAWLDAGLELAQETGDLGQQRNSLISLTWTRFIRSNLGGPDLTAPALAHADQLATVCAELGDRYFEAQAHCVAAVILRLAGRFDDAATRVARAARLTAALDQHHDPLLPAVSFLVRTATGADAGAKPEPAGDPGPLAILSDSLVIETLLLAGRMPEASAHLAGSRLDTGPGASPFLTRLVGVTRGAVLVLSGRYDEAEESLEAARESARSVGAWPIEVTATALLSEVQICRGLPDMAASLLDSVADHPGGVASLLYDRARWLLGDGDAGERLRAGAGALVMPGLALGVG